LRLALTVAMITWGLLFTYKERLMENDLKDMLLQYLRDMADRGDYKAKELLVLLGVYYFNEEERD
jgi:hypothetical protein